MAAVRQYVIRVSSAILGSSFAWMRSITLAVPALVTQVPELLGVEYCLQRKHSIFSRPLDRNFPSREPRGQAGGSNHHGISGESKGELALPGPLAVLGSILKVFMTITSIATVIIIIIVTTIITFFVNVFAAHLSFRFTAIPT